MGSRTSDLMSCSTAPESSILELQLINTNKQNKQETNSVALSPQVNYTDWGPPLVDEI
jgi:hypothetical protein